MNITVIGDLMKNYFLVDQTYPLPLEKYNYHLSGTLLNATYGAAFFFEEIFSIGNISSKDQNQFRNLLTRKNIRPLLQNNGSESTGICIINNDKKGNRIGMISLKQANAFLKLDANILIAINKSDMIFLNGWSFIPSTQTSNTCLSIIKRAKKAKKIIIFDLLPHNIKFNQLDESYLTAIKHANVIVIERSTLKENFIIKDNEIYLKNKVELMELDIIIIFDWVERVTLFKNKKGVIKSEDTFYSNNSPSFFLDKIVFKIIRKYYEV